MAIAKLSSSGKQWQIVLSEDLPAGTVLAVGKGALTMVTMGSIPFARLSILPMVVDANRFPKSEMWGADDKQVEQFKNRVNNLNTNNDAMSKQFKKEREQKKTYEKKVVKF